MEVAERREVSHDDDSMLRLLAEELSVDRETVETGRVRVRTVTRTREEAIDVPLTREEYEITRRPVGQIIETAPPIRQEDDVMVMPVVEEVVVVERRLILKEEVLIRRIRTTERHQENVTLRFQEAEVTRLPAQDKPLSQAEDPR